MSTSSCCHHLLKFGHVFVDVDKGDSRIAARSALFTGKSNRIRQNISPAVRQFGMAKSGSRCVAYSIHFHVDHFFVVVVCLFIYSFSAVVLKHAGSMSMVGNVIFDSWYVIGCAYVVKYFSNCVEKNRIVLLTPVTRFHITIWKISRIVSELTGLKWSRSKIIELKQYYIDWLLLATCNTVSFTGLKTTKLVRCRTQSPDDVSIIATLLTRFPHYETNVVARFKRTWFLKGTFSS